MHSYLIAICFSLNAGGWWLPVRTSEKYNQLPEITVLWKKQSESYFM